MEILFLYWGMGGGGGDGEGRVFCSWNEDLKYNVLSI